MRLINKSKSNVKIFIIFFIIITIIFAIITISMSRSIREYYYNQKRQEAVMIAQSISVYLSRNEDIVDIAYQLVDEQLLWPKAVSTHYGNYSNELIHKLIDDLDINEINIYNTKGVIEYSNKNII